MYDTLLVHGSFGNPNENWFPWLSKKLAAQGRRVLVPHFPEAELQSLERWTAVLDSYSGCFSDDLVVYAHSLGPAFVVDYFTTRRKRLRKAVLVAPFYRLLGIPEFDGVNRTFFLNESRIKDFRKYCERIVCIYSDDDPYVASTFSDRFAELAGATVHIVSGGKHLNESAGFTELPLLLEV